MLLKVPTGHLGQQRCEQKIVPWRQYHNVVVIAAAQQSNSEEQLVEMICLAIVNI